MQDLRLVAVNDAGSHLLLRSTQGEDFHLPIDERLRAATRGDRARLGQLEIALDGQVRPRDIQARIRAGESAEDIAQSAGVPVERVRRFEGPVLAERAHMAQMAQRASTRRAGQPDGAAVVLGEAVAGRLEPLGVREEALDWDSWRREDGRWVVLLTYAVEHTEHRARFVYDPRSRTAVPDDDEARWLAGDLAERPRPARFVPRLAPPLAAPDEPAPPVEDGDGGDRSERGRPERPERGLPEPERGLPERPERGLPERPEREHSAARQRAERPRRASAIDILIPPAASVTRPGRPDASPQPARSAGYAEPARPAQSAQTAQSGPTTNPERQQGAEHADRAEPTESPAARKPSSVEHPHPAFLPRRDDPGAQRTTIPPKLAPQHPDPTAASAAPPLIPREERLTGTTDAGPDRPVERPGRAPSGRNRRASVPSWDEILFGTRRHSQ